PDRAGTGQRRQETRRDSSVCRPQTAHEGARGAHKEFLHRERARGRRPGAEAGKRRRALPDQLWLIACGNLTMAAAKKALPKTCARKSESGGSRTNEASPGNAPNLVPPHGSAGIRVRMFRIGFGDFFLLSVPAAGGSKHILIDCGVHATDLKTIGT